MAFPQVVALLITKLPEVWAADPNFQDHPWGVPSNTGKRYTAELAAEGVPMPVIRDQLGRSSLPAPSLSTERRAPAPASGSADLGLARRLGIARRSAPGAAGDVPDGHRFFGDLIQDPVPADP